MISTVFFDMGNVLLNFSHERMFRQIADVCGLSAGRVHRLLTEGGIQTEVERGRISERDLHALFVREAGRDVDFRQLLHAASNIFDPNEAIVSVVQELSAAGRRLVLLSNTSESHFRFVRKEYPVLDLFDDFILSFEVGAMKPSPEIYEAALRVAGCAPEECFYTDDIPEYVAAGRAHGFQAEVFTTVDGLRGHLRDRGVPGLVEVKTHAKMP
jgi:glucose-1-phosphatase